MNNYILTSVAGLSAYDANTGKAWYKFPFEIVYLIYYVLFTIVSLIGLFIVLMIANLALMFRKKPQSKNSTTPVTF